MTESLVQDVTDCPACGRRTPAARAACMYCGAALGTVAIKTAPPQRALDSFELAFNTILDPDPSVNDERKEALLADALNMDLTEAQAFLNSPNSVPVARSQTRQEAELIAALLRTCGVASRVVEDQDLNLSVDLIRARRVERLGDELKVTHSGGSVLVPLEAIKLLVLGILKNTRVDFTEARAGIRGQGSAVMETIEFRSADVMLDVYSTSLERSFRIKSDAFDYSGLVWPLAFQVETNFYSAIAALKEILPDAVYDAEFSKMRNLLSRAWPERSKVESKGVKRAGLTQRPVAQSSVTSDNRDQFERYSRLRFLSV